VLLILDNVNSEGLWRELGGAAYSYCALRPNDRVVFGSIDKVELTNLRVEHLEVTGLDLEAAAELVRTSGVSMSSQDLVKLHHGSRGLPLYLRLLAARETRSTHSAATLDEELIPHLPPDTRQLLAYMSLIALLDRRISISELRRCPIANLERQLATAENRTLIAPIPTHRERRFKIHDVVRDTALRTLQPDVEPAALFLFERALGRGKLERAALFAMFTDPQRIEPETLDELLEDVIRDAIKTKNYALLASLHGRASENGRIMRFLSADEARADLFSFARASELAGLGRYTEAEEEMLSSSIPHTRWRHSAEATDLQADLRFLQADIAHLLNRYEQAGLMFEELGTWAVAHERPSLEALCVWGHGHVLRHQGRDLDRALELFDRAVDLATATGNLFAKAYSICNASGVTILTNAVPDDQEERLRAIEDEIATGSTHHGYLLEVWKTQAQLSWWRGRNQAASETVDAAIDRALELNDRLLYNLYFERAEFRRLGGEPAAALEDYRTVLEFGEGNRDRNLVSNALLGLVLSEIACGGWLHHGSATAARVSVLRARQVALEADIQITVRTAEAVTAMLDDAELTAAAVRLFLL
jgi:tetratricopeptide (TPR) repeat protein